MSAENPRRVITPTGASQESNGSSGPNAHDNGTALAIATARGKRSRNWTLETTTWAEVAAWVTDPRTGPKDGPAYVLGELAECDCGTPRTPHAHRNKETVVSRGVLTLDVDHLTPTTRDSLLVKLREMGCAAVYYSTFSATPDAPRLRLLLLLNRPVSPAEYARLADLVMHQLGWELFDPGSREPSRLMFMPTRGQNGHYEHDAVPGDPVPVDEWLARWEPTEIARSHPSAKQEPTEVPGLVGVFNREYTVEEAITVFGLPYEPAGDRLIYTDSTSGEPGVVRLSDDLVFSHHTSDPAYGQACSAFDLVRLHRFGDLDVNSRPETRIENRPSHKAMLNLAREDPRVAHREASETFQTPGVEAVELPDAITLDECHAVFRKWMGDSYDLGALDVVLAVAAVERLDGDPLWVLVVAGPGNAKTETVQTLKGVGALAVSTIASEGALLSATSARDRSPTATGGLLRQVQPRGLVVIKDVTSILSMSRDARGAVLGALREVYDGAWTRTVGTDGGKTLSWNGRIGLVGAVTTAWDKAHTVVAAMGDRFVLVRTDSRRDRIATARRTLANTGREEQMRAELAEAVAGVIAGLGEAPTDLTDDEAVRLVEAANLVTLARTAVERDYRGDVDEAHDPEAPTRFARQLQQVFRGAVALGADRDDALALAVRCARDSMPPLRLRIIDYLAAHPDRSATEIYRGLDEPRSSVRREVDALHALGVLTVDREEPSDFDDERPYSGWRYSLHPDLDSSVIALADPMWRGVRTAGEADDLI